MPVEHLLSFSQHEVIADVKSIWSIMSRLEDMSHIVFGTHSSLDNMSTRQAIDAPAAPKPNGNYSHVVRSGDKLYLCGWMGDDPKTGEIVEGDIGTQTVRIHGAHATGLGSQYKFMVGRTYMIIHRNKQLQTSKLVSKQQALHSIRSSADDYS